MHCYVDRVEGQHVRTRRYDSTVIRHVADTIELFKNNSAVHPTIRQKVVGQLLELKQNLAGLPAAFGVTIDGTNSSDDGKGLLQEVIEAFKLCHDDLYLCYQKYKANTTFSFPVGHLDFEISKRYSARRQGIQQRLTTIELQIKDAVERLQEQYPNLAAKLGVKRDEVAGLLSQMLTSDLYGAAFGSAAVAYYSAYLDTVLSFILFNTRFQIFINPRAIIYRTIQIFQGVIGSIFYGLTYVPLFPQLINPVQRVPILVSTAVRTGQAFRSSMDLLNEATLNNTVTAMQRRDYVLDQIMGSMKTTSDAFEQQLAAAAPNLADLYGSVATTVQLIMGTGSQLRKEAQQAVLAQGPLRGQFMNQTTDILKSMTGIAMDLVNSTSNTIGQARDLIDNLIPGQRPAQIIRDVQLRISDRMTEAQHNLQRLVPLADVQGLVEVFNSTVTGLLAEVNQAAQQVQASVPGPAFRTAVDTVQQGLTAAQKQLDGVFAAFDSNYPGPLLNASLMVINHRTQAVVNEINSVVDEARSMFPALDPQRLFGRLNQSIDDWWSQATDPARAFKALLPADVADKSIQELKDQMMPLFDSVSAALGKAAKDLANLVVPSVRAATQPTKQTIQGLTDLVNQVNNMIRNLNDKANQQLAEFTAQVSDRFRMSDTGNPDSVEFQPLQQAAPASSLGNLPGVQAYLPLSNVNTSVSIAYDPGFLGGVQRVSDQVSSLLNTIVLQRPVTTGLLADLDKSLKGLHQSLQQQEQQGGGLPAGLLQTAVKSAVNQVNATTQLVGSMMLTEAVAELVSDAYSQLATHHRPPMDSSNVALVFDCIPVVVEVQADPAVLTFGNVTLGVVASQSWQAAVRLIDLLAGNTVGTVPKLLVQQLDNARQSIVGNLAAFNDRVAGFGLTWANRTAEYTHENFAQTLDGLLQALDTGQQLAGQLSVRLTRGADRLATRIQNQPTNLNDTLEAYKSRLATAIGVPVDELQSAVANTTKAWLDWTGPGLVGGAAAVAADTTNQALQALHRRLAPVLLLLRPSSFYNNSSLQDSYSAYRRGIWPSNSFMQRLADGIDNALQSTQQDWIQSFRTQAGLGSKANATLPSLIASLRLSSKQAQSSLRSRLRPLLTQPVFDYQQPEPVSTLMPEVRLWQQAVQRATGHLGNIQSGLRQAQDTTTAAALPTLYTAADSVLAQRLQDWSQTLMKESVGGMFSVASDRLSSLLNDIQQTMDDYLQTKVTSPADLVNFAREQLSNIVSGTTNDQPGNVLGSAAGGNSNGLFQGPVQQLLHFLQRQRPS